MRGGDGRMDEPTTGIKLPWAVLPVAQQQPFRQGVDRTPGSPPRSRIGDGNRRGEAIKSPLVECTKVVTCCWGCLSFSLGVILFCQQICFRRESMLFC